MRSRMLILVVIAAIVSIILVAGAAEAFTLTWPVRGTSATNLGRAYADYVAVETGTKYHTGLDIGANSGSDVLAAAGGRVRRLDSGTFSNENHCMGNVVIIDHTFLSEPVGLFTLYAHLANITAQDGATVSAGAVIGTVGNTGTGCNGRTPSNPHLHFELKERGVLGDLGDDAAPGTTCCWGYTPDHPNYHGYLDPLIAFPGVTAIVPIRRIRITEDGVNVRVGPGASGGTAYRTLTQVNSGESYHAQASSPSTTTPSCPGGWYRIVKTDDTRFVDTGQSGEIAAGWVCADFTSKTADVLTLTGLATDLGAPQSVGTEVTITATATGGTPPYQYRWWLYDVIDGWFESTEWWDSPSVVLIPDEARTSYRIGVWVRSAGNTVDAPEGGGEIPFPIRSAIVASVTVTADKLSPQSVGSTITFTATATGGVAPYQYKWWVYDGASWRAQKTWSSSPTFAWTPTVAGNAYGVAVWVRGSGNLFEAPEAGQGMGFAIH